MTELPGYELIPLWKEAGTALLRGTRAGADRVLVVRGSNLERAFCLRNELDRAWAAVPVELIEQQGQRLLVSEDPGGELLANRLAAPWPIAPFLRVALGLAKALRALHARGLVHKDVKPSNILTDVAAGTVWLTGFGLTSALARERQAPEPPEVIAGTLAYMAPEQTGRMNRSIDSRSDLYSFGITLYQMLSGRLPFMADDAMGWVHCHVARAPAPLDAVVPTAIANIVMKLLSKTADDRYQTAAGVERDLERVRLGWELDGKVEPFLLGKHDVSERLHLPEKLYGRDTEIRTLLSSFDRVLTQHRAQLVLVSGYSGIGKSSVVSELHRVLVPPRGLYASGKFDQYNRDIPYGTLAQALAVLVRHVLGRSESEIARFREESHRVLASSGALMTNLVPELELVIGKQPPVPELPPIDAQARFQALIRRFIGVFARKGQPLVLFLDDLQWLDAATLDLLDPLMEVPDLLVVGAYRDNEVGPEHPLARTLEKLRASERVREIVLSPLATSDVAALLADALHAESADVQPLAELVHEKTGGNPFFAIQFISMLVDERLLVFDTQSSSWRWDIRAIHAKGFTDNVVELMTLKIHRLPLRTRNALRQFACLGNTARTGTLSLVSESTEEEVHLALSDAVNAGLIHHTGGVYAFLHDRVHEATYTTIAPEERVAEHMRIGRLLAARTPAGELEESIFEIVNHLNRGAQAIESVSERDRIAELDLIAARRANAATAHAAARTYATMGQTLLGASGWDRQFRLMFDLDLLLANCEFVMADFEAAERRLDGLGARAQSLTDRAAVIFVQTNLFTALLARADRAVASCLDYLHELKGFEDWTAHPTEALVLREYEAVRARLTSSSFDELLKRPFCSDANVAATNEVLLGMFTPAFNTDVRLFALVLLRLANLGFEHGVTEALSLAFTFVGMVVGSMFGDYRTGAAFGKLARDLVEQRGMKRYAGRIYHTLGTHVLCWTEHARRALVSLERGLTILQDEGDVAYASFAHIGVTCLKLEVGEPLDTVQKAIEHALAIVRPGGFEIAIDSCIGQLRLVRALRGELADPCHLEDIRGWTNDHTGLDRTRGWYWVRVLQACFVFGDFEAGRQAAEHARPFIHLSRSFVELVDYHYFAALVADDREVLLQHRGELATWADHCPANYGHRLALVDAELARLEGRALEAMDGYERAIRLARENGFVNHEAMAHDVAARFYLARGSETIADAFLHRARAAYRTWGAHGKVRQLDERYPRLRADSPGESAIGNFDLATVVKTSQAVSLQVGVDRLIESLMTIALQHAGAERGLLVLQRDHGLSVEAEATTTREGVSVYVRSRGMADIQVAQSVVQYVLRSRETVLIDDAQLSNPFSSDEILSRRCRSVLCLPLVRQTEVVGALYLENNLAPHVFTPSRVEVLKVLASQAALSLENASLEEKESLLKEVHHRVKNNLQLISSLLNLQASKIKDPAVAELFAESRNRVRSMALVHENLYRAGNFSRIPMAAHIQALCAQLQRAYGAPERPIALEVEVAELELDMSRAVTCGLIVNELVSNALKHAFPNGGPGHIRVKVERRNGSHYALSVCDDGVGIPANFDIERADSLGLQLVSDLSHQLRGTVEVGRKGAGTAITIVFEQTSSS